jgi:predicted glycosyl hydrolase (DUF1957 family)
MIKNILEDAKNLIVIEGWGRDKDGKWCAATAITQAASKARVYEQREAAQKAFAEANGFTYFSCADIWYWNDNKSTAKQVLAGFDKAIEAAS